VARTHPHAFTPGERAEITPAAVEDATAHLHHRKLTHTLSRQGRVFCSESSTLRILREEGLVPAYRRTRKPKRTKPEGVTDVEPYVGGSRRLEGLRRSRGE